MSVADDFWYACLGVGILMVAVGLANRSSGGSIPASLGAMIAATSALRFGLPSENWPLVATAIAGWVVATVVLIRSVVNLRNSVAETH